MLESIKNFFATSMTPSSEKEASTGAEDIRLAACALLLELANADDEFTDDERQHMESAVRRQFGLDATEAEQRIWSPRTTRRVRRWCWPRSCGGWSTQTGIWRAKRTTSCERSATFFAWSLVTSPRRGSDSTSGANSGLGAAHSGVTSASRTGIFRRNERPTRTASDHARSRPRRLSLHSRGLLDRGGHGCSRHECRSDHSVDRPGASGRGVADTAIATGLPRWSSGRLRVRGRLSCVHDPDAQDATGCGDWRTMDLNVRTNP